MVKCFSWVAVVFWMAAIFYLSNQPATVSDELSTGITVVILQALERIFHHIGLNIGEFDHIVRKNAHFFVYLVLGLLVFNAFRKNGFYGNRVMGMAFSICVLYAITDEIHQIFVPGRGPAVKDVLIDSAGALVGLGLYQLIGRRLKKASGKLP